ncbi:ABC transporter substrate-binding protein [Nisaea acidiphila]|uniref:ABC transporter substrate-binding protein n=1 Tax=Nisaea acidiphila TaxID=1862145 RepID=A0A9J7B1I2_9PROT|nr:ABC transporter substrate-binding protein [Nisaea acidiphila]UUX51525.1 ABC transporter substrate-binding protein [Nisaea acidiphila]
MRSGRGRSVFRTAVRLVLCLFLWGAFSLSAGASTKSPAKHIVILSTLSSPLLDTSIVWFRKEMAERGYVDGDNVSYEFLNAEGDIVQAVSLLSSAIAKRRPDLILTVATLATRAGRELLAATRIPQLFMIVTDPVDEGLTQAMGTPSGSNVTGQSHVVPAESQLAVVSEVLRTAKREAPFRIAILRSDYPSALSVSAQLRAAAPNYPAIELVELGFPYRPGDSGSLEMKASALRLIEQHRKSLDGLWLVAGPNQANRAFVAAVQETGVPIVNSGNIGNARRGAMVALQSTAEFIGKDAAETAVTILAGTDPGEIPITRPRQFVAGVNVTTAGRLGAVIPSAILELAQGNVFH